MVADYKGSIRRQTRKNRNFFPASLHKLLPTNPLYLSVIVFFFVLFAFLRVRVAYITKEKEVQAKLVLKQKLESEILPMQLEERYLTRLEIVEKVATRELGLRPPEKARIRRIIIRPD